MSFLLTLPCQTIGVTTARSVRGRERRSYMTRRRRRSIFKCHVFNTKNWTKNIFGGLKTIPIFALSIRLDSCSIYSGLIEENPLLLNPYSCNLCGFFYSTISDWLPKDVIPEHCALSYGQGHSRKGVPVMALHVGGTEVAV